MGTITIKNFLEASESFERFDAVISMEDVVRGPKLRIPDDGRAPPQLVLAFHDLDYDDGRTEVCTEEHIHQALAFARHHAGGDLLIHCQAGKCRSPAIALAILADRLGPGREEQAVSDLLRIRDVALPNRVALEMADAALSRGGCLISAWRAVEDGDNAMRARRDRKQALWEDFWAKGPQTVSPTV